MSNSPVEQEPGRALKIARYRSLRWAQRTAEKDLGKLTVNEAQMGAAEPLINIKDKTEEAAGIIRRDLKGRT